MRIHRLSVLLVGWVTLISAQSAKRPLNHRDYDPWRSIPTQLLSHDGHFLAYAMFPEEGDGELVVRNLATGREVRQNVGALPPAPDNPNVENPAEEAQASRGIRLAFTHDGRYFLSGTYPRKAETDQAKKDRKRPDEMPRPGMIVVDTASLTATSVADVASFQVPENAADLVVWLKGPKPGDATPPAAPPAGQDDEEDQRRGSAASAGVVPRRTLGSDLVLRDLARGSERSFEDVLEYQIAKDSKTLVYTVGSKKEETNGIYSVAPETADAPAGLLTGKGRYSKLTWDFAQRQIAFLSDRDDAAAKPGKFKAYLWDRKAAAPVELVSTATPGFRDGYAISDRGAMNFSRDGSHLFVSCAPWAAIAALPAPGAPPALPVAPSDDKYLADLWNWKDDFTQPMQKVRAAQERSRSYMAGFDIANKKFLQLSDPSMMGLIPDDDGRYALGTDDRAYRHMVDYDGSFNDLYIVDTATGARKLVIEKLRGAGGPGLSTQWAPDGKHLLTFRDNQWWAIGVPDGKLVNLTGRIATAFHNEDHDSPGPATAYGAAGWTKDGKSALVYDRYDVWAIAPDTLAARKLTDGRSAGIQFRVVRLQTGDEEERGIDPAKPLLLHAENLETRETGFYSLPGLEGSAQPRKLIMGPKNYRLAINAKEADVLVVTATTFHDQPDLQVTDSSFRQLKTVTNMNPQQAGILWGSGGVDPLSQRRRGRTAGRALQA